MIRAPQENQQSSGGQANRGRGQQQQQGYPTIKATDLSFDKRLVKINFVRESDQVSTQANGQKWSDYVLQVTMNGRIMLLYLKITNPVFKTLYEAFGADENSWPGSQFYLFLEEDKITGKHWMRAEALAEDKTEDKPAPRQGRR